MSGENEGSAEQQDPGTAQEQIEQQILTDQVMAMVPFANLPYTLSRMVPSAGGAGYEFDPAEVDTVIAKLRDVQEKALSVEGQLMNVGFVNAAPADDGPSNRQAIATQKALANARDRNSDLLKYASNFISKLEEAKKAYGQAEGTNAGNVGRQA